MSELEPTRTYSNPTATDVLRRLLDERGVEWHRGKLAMLDDEYTQWWVSDRMEGFVAYECDYPLNTLIVRGITPEQAIAATLGSFNCTNDCTNGERTGTCHPIISDNLAESEGTGDAWADCSECGHLLFVLTDPNSQVPNFCPNCGRIVEQ